MREILDLIVKMSVLDLLAAIAGAATIALTIRIVINKSRRTSSKQSFKARDHATFDDRRMHVEGDYHEAPRTGIGSKLSRFTFQFGLLNVIRGPEPKERPLLHEERELLSLIEPGKHFTIENTLGKDYVIYGMPKGPLEYFRDQRDPTVATANIEALLSLVKRRLIKKGCSNDHPIYTLTDAGIEAKKSLLPRPTPAEPETFSDIERDLLLAIELDSVFRVFRRADGSRDFIKVRVAGKRTALFSFPDDPVKILAHMEALDSLRDRGYLSQENDVYRPTVKGYEAAKKLQADSTS